jgi:uncharacterized protein YlzI (FlbEa/FlbD family)
MKRKQFITLTISGSLNKLHLNSWMICAISEINESTRITTMEGGSYYVKEKPDEVIKMVDSAQNLTYFNTEQ